MKSTNVSNKQVDLNRAARFGKLVGDAVRIIGVIIPVVVVAVKASAKVLKKRAGLG